MATSTTNRKLKILLMGSSGVGKSRFINSFANYVYYNSLDEIKTSSDVKAPIPCIFQLNDENDESKVFCVGEERNQDQNESLKLMDSQTQSCKAYEFKFEDMSITLIDTPGLVDNGGVKQDTINLKNTLEFISKYETIDAICIILRPDEQRDTVAIRYCFLEILGQLDRNASTNIVFAFTHSRRTRYGKGPISNKIEEIIKNIRKDKPGIDIKYSKENCFYFDNEAFEYLVAKHEIQFDETEKPFYAQSWKKSKEECFRMLKFVENLQTEINVGDILSISWVRQLIQSLLGPLLDIGENIRENEKSCKDKVEELNRFEGDISELRGKLFIPRTELEMVHYDSPRILCSSTKCSKKLNLDGIEKIHYKQTCFKAQKPIMQYVTEAAFGTSAGLTPLAILQEAGVAAATTASTLLGIAGAAVTVSALAGITGWYYFGTCSNCNCNNSEHVLKYFETKKVQKNIVDPKTQKKLKSTENLANEKQTFIYLLQEELSQLKQEKEIIDRANSVFAVYLTHRCMTPYNDAYEQYLDYLVRQEEVSNVYSPEKIESLKDQSEEYKNLKKALEKGSEDSSIGITGNDIDSLYIEGIVAELCNLKRYGNLVKKIVEETKIAKQNHETVPGRREESWKFEVANLSSTFKGCFLDT